MKTIGLISDTHSYINKSILDFFKDVDEIWHAGDIGSLEVVHKLENMKPLKAVFGNIDGTEIRMLFNEIERFRCENIDVILIHIGGYPGKYSKEVKKLISEKPAQLFISGHSHILKVIYDKKLGMMHINPGAAGLSGFHLVRTAIKFTVDNEDIKDLKILEIKRG
jgi:putative phosphoesterase